MEKLIQEAVEKLGDPLINITEQTVVDELETRDVDHNYAVMKGAVRSALNGFLVYIMGDSSDNRKSFEDAIVQVATALKSSAIIVSAVARDVATMASTAWYASKIVKQVAEESVRDLHLTSPSPPPFALFFYTPKTPLLAAELSRRGMHSYNSVLYVTVPIYQKLLPIARLCYSSYYSSPQRL